jgi:hypothetical protein
MSTKVASALKTMTLPEFLRSVHPEAIVTTEVRKTVNGRPFIMVYPRNEDGTPDTQKGVMVTFSKGLEQEKQFDTTLPLAEIATYHVALTHPKDPTTGEPLVDEKRYKLIRKTGNFLTIEDLEALIN